MKRKWLLALSLIAIVATFTTAGFLLQSPASAQTFAVSVSGLHVSGNQLLNSSNQVVRPLGVDRSGTEYMCDSAGSTTVLDGPSDATSVNAMLSWNINAVRVPLNEDCWLGINGYPAAQYSAAAYQQAIVNYVNLLTANHLIVILDLHWSAPGTQQANKQLPMPDADHAPAFWTSVANTFKSNSSVIFDLYNEPFTTSWSCWLNGSSSANASPCGDVGFAVAGMQTLVNTVRATGATNVLMLGGLAYSNDLSQWLQFKPNDPLNNLVASFHVYNFNACSNVSCWNAQVAPVAAVVPVIAGEMGENDCQSGFINSVMSWLDQHNIGYLGWAWNADFNCSSGPGLISNYDGTPTQFGLGLKNHLAALAGGSGGGSTPTPGTTPTPRTTPTPGTTPTPVTTPTPTPTSGGSCRVSYTVQNQWQGGFTTNITITNTGSTVINGWTLAFTFPGNQQVVQGWSGTFTQQGSNVTVRNLSYNGSLAPGSSTSFGFNGSWSGSNSSPTSFTLNGARCS